MSAMAVTSKDILRSRARPSLEEVKVLAKQGNCVPVYVEDMSDLLTPVTAYLKLGLDSETSFLLESSAGPDSTGRYSFIGANAQNIIVTNDADPLVEVEKALSTVRYVAVKGLPHFTGGAVGYVGFDCIHHFEPLTKQPLEDVLGVPDSIFMMANDLVVFDHVCHVFKAVSHVKFAGDSVDDETLHSLYSQAVERVVEVVMSLRQEAVPLPPQGKNIQSHTATSNVGRAGYESFVVTLKSHIVQGDIFQAVPSQRVSRPIDVHPFNVYRKMRTINPSPYMFYINLGTFQLVGASPEALVKVVEGVVETHPIAGTRRRGATPEEDQALAKELLADEKERAEHVMLVDLGRNDLNRVAIPETVKVTKLMAIEYFSHVMHIVSRVAGTLRPECSIYDAFRSVFPAGTVSGAPKIRAVQLIQGLEKIKRHVYAGAVGWFSYSGDMDTCIALRTILVKDGIAYMQAGGGIVFDSDPTAEYEETVNKMSAAVAAIEQTEGHFGEASCVN